MVVVNQPTREAYYKEDYKDTIPSWGFHHEQANIQPRANAQNIQDLNGGQ
jgi:hypothetical protein